MDDTPSPAWAKGIDMGFLKRMSALFKADHGPHCYGAFGLMKELDIAEARAAGNLIWTKEGDACAIFRKAKSKTDIEDFAGNVAHVMPGDIAIKAAAGPGLVRLLPALMMRAEAPTVWLEGFVENAAFVKLAHDLGFVQVMTKIAASSDLKGVWHIGEGKGRLPKALPDCDKPSRAILDADFISDDERAAILGEADAAAELWAQHYSTYNKRHSWMAFSLQGFDPADPTFIIKPVEMSKKWKAENPGRLTARCEPTMAAERFPVAMAVAARVPGAKERIRLMRLSSAGGELARHADITDPDAGTRDGHLSRIHIPLRSDPKCLFFTWDLDGTKHETHFPERAACYLDTRKPHAVKNPATVDRVHLVMDTFATPELRDMIAVHA